jgi:Flp pilus assembly protein TadG
MNGIPYGAPRRPLRLRTCGGTTALEFAFVAPVFLLLLLGAVELGRALKMRSGLQYAVQQAARCAVVNTTLCGTTAQVQDYAASQVFGRSTPASAFSVQTVTCGRQVSASQVFTSMARPLIPFRFILRAAACQPG